MIVSFPRRSLFLSTFASAIALATTVTAQCTNPWSSNFVPGGQAGTNGVVWATTAWDPDGAGPAAPWLVVGGEFSTAGGVAVDNIAAWDPVGSTWHALGAGIDGIVHALAVTASGQLVAGGAFTSAGGVAAGNVASWDGSAWSPLGAGTNGGVYALTTAANGDLIVGGDFTLAGAVSINDLARWDGTSWSIFGNVVGGSVSALLTLPNGDIVAGGWFERIHGQPMQNVGRWDGTSWQSMGATFDSFVLALALGPNGDVYAGGYFLEHLSRWDGSSWSPVAGATDSVMSLASLQSGDLVVGGWFTRNAGGPGDRIATYDGATWSPLGAGTDWYPYSICTMPNGDVAVGGGFTTAGSVEANHVSIWNGAQWTALGTESDGDVFAVQPLPNGDLVVGGSFQSLFGVAIDHVALASSGTFSALGGGVDGAVRAIVRMPNGDVIAGGDFGAAGGVSAHRVARWDGAQWSALGGGLLSPSSSNSVRSLLVLPNGDLLVGGDVAHGLQRWDGSGWSTFGAGGGEAHAILRLPDDSIVIGTHGTMFGPPAVQRWDGAAWAPYGPYLNGRTLALALLPNGDVAAYGSYVLGGWTDDVLRYDGTNWTQTGLSMTGGVLLSAGPGALHVLPDGDLLAVGAGVGGGEHVARFDGSSWQSVGGGFDAPAHAVASLPDGDLVFGGAFAMAGSTPSARLARLTTDCPATVASYGSGCASSAGLHQLTVTDLPWLGATFAASTDGMPATSIGAGVFGFAQIALPLPAVLAQGVPGCTLLAFPDFWSLDLPAAGTVTTSLPIPPAPALVGASFAHQVVAFELAPSGTILAVTSSNAVTATIGAF